MGIDKNSMLYWWKLVKDLPIPKPKTIIIKLKDKDSYNFYFCFWEHLEGNESEECIKFRKRAKEIFNELKEAVNKLGGYPVFLRTDYTSGKHYSYSNPLYRINDEKDLDKVWTLIAECHDPGGFFAPPLPNAIVLREWLNIEKWTNLINRYNTIEVRLFIKDGRVVEIYPYYHWSGLEERVSDDILEELRKDYEENLVGAIKRDLNEIIKYAEIIAERVGGYWSVDFAGTDKGWYFIDMALGKRSWKPKETDELDRELLSILKT